MENILLNNNAYLECVVEAGFLEGDLARLPEVLLAHLLLRGLELGDVRLVALGDVVVPALLDLLLLQLLHELGLDDAEGAVGLLLGLAEVDGAVGLLLDHLALHAVVFARGLLLLAVGQGGTGQEQARGSKG